jgi:hypothetical protein
MTAQVAAFTPVGAQEVFTAALLLAPEALAAVEMAEATQLQQGQQEQQTLAAVVVEQAALQTVRRLKLAVPVDLVS